MPLTIPTLSQLNDQAQATINARIPGADSRLRFSVLGGLATAMAGLVQGVYGYGQWLAKQIFLQTAEGGYLDLLGAVYARGLTRNQASVSTGTVAMAGLPGSVIPAQTQLQRADQTVFITDEAVTIANDGTASATVTSAMTGAATATAPNTVLSFLSPPSGVNATASVAMAGLVGGADFETDEAYRTRCLLVVQTPPQGGSVADYDQWARTVPGVSRVFVTPLAYGDGTVGVRFTMDGIRTNGIPLSGDVDAVKAAIAPLQPANMAADACVVEAPTTQAINFTIDLRQADTTTIRNAVVAQLADLLLTEGTPGGTILKSHISEAIQQAEGVIDHVLTVPSADVVMAAGAIPIMGTVTWV